MQKTAAPSAPGQLLAARGNEFRDALLSWYRSSRRDLPWRSEPSAYKTVVSEFMLQQTQVKTVLPYFERWLKALPDFASLARASEAEVLKLWEGLGYYSRARNLQKLARELATRRALPTSAEAWLELPGVGPYTAAAVTSIAFGQPAACVDGNVVRILARLSADETSFRDSVGAAKHFAPLATLLINREAPGDHNQAMMELGATVCTKANPSCILCPVSALCEGRRKNLVEALPRLSAKKTERQEQMRLWCEEGGRLLLHQVHGGARRLASLHELPTPEQAGLSSAALRELPPLATRSRSITRFRIKEIIVKVPSPQGPLPSGLQWVRLTDLDSVTLSGPHRRWISELLGSR